MIIGAFTTAAIASFGYLAIVAARPLAEMYRNRLLYRSYLSREEQASVEKNLSRLSRVVVMCDRVDPPTRGFLEAVKDNFANGVSYVFLVSSRATSEELDRYLRVFEKIETSVRAEAEARAEIDGLAVVARARLFEVHRLHQEWNDFPYICYEFYSSNDDAPELQYLMYRGCDMGVGIADEYVRISPETAYSLIKRADALKVYIAAARDGFVSPAAGALNNEPASSVVPWTGPVKVNRR